MSSTITLTGDWLANIGNRRQTTGTGNIGVYVTNGITVTAAQVGLGVIESLEIDPAGGYTFSYVASTGKVQAYVAGGAITPDGTITVDGSAAQINITGGQGAGVPVQIDVDTASAVLGKTTTTNRAATAAITGVTAAFTGSGTTASVAEVTSTTDLTSVVFNFRAYGR